MAPTKKLMENQIRRLEDEINNLDNLILGLVKESGRGDPADTDQKILAGVEALKARRRRLRLLLAKRVMRYVRWPLELIDHLNDDVQADLIDKITQCLQGSDGVNWAVGEFVQRIWGMRHVQIEEREWPENG